MVARLAGAGDLSLRMIRELLGQVLLVDGWRQKVVDWCSVTGVVVGRGGDLLLRMKRQLLGNVFLVDDWRQRDVG